MDAFWFIGRSLPGWIPRSLLRFVLFAYVNAPELAPGLFTPFAIVLVTFVCVMIALLKRLPEAPNNPRVLVDKPSEPPAVEESVQARDWSSRPCGSYLEWLSEADKGPAK